MLVRVFPSRSQTSKRSLPAMQAIHQSALNRGHKVIFNEAGPCDLNVAWTIRKPERFGNDAPVCIIESGYTCRRDDLILNENDYLDRRVHNFSISWNNFNQLATWIPEGNPCDRWEKLGIELQPWKRSGGEYVLVLGQTAGDITVCHDYRTFLHTMVEFAEASQPLPVRLRYHPLVKVTEQSLSTQLERAAMCVTFSSNAAVEAVIAGVPTMVFSKNSVAYPVTSHILTKGPRYADRQQWANDLAYRQYTLQELRDGTAWEQIEYGHAQVLALLRS